MCTQNIETSNMKNNNLKICDTKALKCIKSIVRLPWQEISDSCADEYGAHLLETFTEKQQLAVTTWIDTVKTDEYNGVWLGLNDIGHPGVMYSVSLNAEPSWENWAFGEPTTEYAGTACGFLAEATSNSVWSTDRCGVNHGKVCMKAVGRQCPSGWIYHTAENGSGKCYQYFVNGGAHESWYTARNYCGQIGATMITIKSQSEQTTISKVCFKTVTGVVQSTLVLF